MPQFDIVTKSSKEIWKTPDGQRVLYEVVFEYNGKQVQSKTWSKAVAALGFSGTVETYEKEGKNGVETFIKQPQKAGDKAYQPKDEAAIKAMWAIGQAIAWLSADQGKAETAISVGDIEPLAKDLFAMVERVKTGEAGLDISELKDVFNV